MEGGGGGPCVSVVDRGSGRLRLGSWRLFG